MQDLKDQQKSEQKLLKLGDNTGNNYNEKIISERSDIKLERTQEQTEKKNAVKEVMMTRGTQSNKENRFAPK